MEYIKHLIILKWDLFMADFYGIVLMIGFIAVMMVLATIIAVITKIKQSFQERIKSWVAARPDRDKKKKIAHEEALRKVEMKT